MIESYGNALIRYKKLILVVLSMLTIVTGLGLLNSSITADFRVYFDPEHEDTKVFENIEEAFGSLDLLYIAVVPHDSDTVYSKEYLSMLDSFANELSYVPHNVRVESLTNHQRAISTEDGLSIDPLFDGAQYDDASAIPDQVLTEIEAYVQSNQLLTNLMVSDQGDVGAVKVSFKFSSDINERTQQMHESVLFVESLIEKYEGQYQAISFHMIGSLILNHQIGRSIVQDLLTCVPISYVLVTFLLYFLLARQSIFLVFTVITVADIIVLGITGWLDIILTPMLAFVPSTIMVIGIADCIHLLTNYYNNLCDGQTQKQALIESLKKNFRAITITSVTTMAGFLCLSFSPSPVYRQLGYLMAGGTFAAYVLSVTLLPIMLMYCKIPKQLHRPRVLGLMTWLSQSMAQHHKKYLVGCFVVIVAMSAPIYKNQLNDNWHNYFEPSVKLRQDTDIINDRISGLHTIEYLMHADNGTWNVHEITLTF